MSSPGWRSPATVAIARPSCSTSETHADAIEVRRINSYDPAVDNPATRGGRSVTIVGDDGVRDDLADFDSIVDGLEPDTRSRVASRSG
jgi:hypothetical protein